MPQVDPDLGGNFVQGNTVQGRENEETEEVPWSDSQQNLTALLKQANSDTPPQQ